MPPRRIDRQHRFDDADEVVRQVRAHVAEMVPRVAAMRAHQFVHRPAVHRVAARHQVEQQHAERVDVGLLRRGAAVEELRSEI